MNALNQKSSGGPGGEYKMTPASRGIDAVQATAKDAFPNALGSGESSDKWIRHAMQTAGYVFGLPLDAPGATIQFLWDLHTGTQAAQSAGDWYRGLLTGKAQ